MPKKATSSHIETRRTIDWNEIYDHLAQTSAKLAVVDEVPPDVLEKTWERRAAQLAREIEEDTSGEKIEIVVVRIGQELYGVEVPYVFDIRTEQSITRVPRTPAWVAGVVNLRGRVMSVLDLAAYLGLPAASNQDQHEKRLLVVETPKMELALLVDEVLSIEPIAISAIQEATTTVRGIRAEFVRGLVVREAQLNVQAENGVQKHDEMLVILDLPALLADPGLIVQEEVN